MFTQSLSNFIGAAFLAWNGMLATGLLPDIKTIHYITVGLTGVQILFTNLGFNRTPAGTPIPESVSKFVDRTEGNVVAAEVSAIHPSKPDVETRTGVE